MHSPFPGMDTFLESRWPEVHARLIVYATNQINQHLPDDLQANIEENLAVYAENHSGQSIRPDVNVAEDPFILTASAAVSTKAEKLIGLNGQQAGQSKQFSHPGSYQKPLQPNPIGQHALRGMTQLGMKTYRTPLAVITEDHEPSGHKVPRNASGHLHPEAAKTGLSTDTATRWV